MLSLEGARSFFTIDEPGDLDSIRPKREPVVMRHDVDHDAMPGAHACRPGVLHSPIGAAVEIGVLRSEEHTSVLQSLMRTSYVVFCLKKKQNISNHVSTINTTNST